MKEWKHTISGKLLREAITNGEDNASSAIATLELLKFCYNKIHSKIEEDDWRCDFDWPYEVVSDDIEFLKEDGNLSDIGFDSFYDLVNDRLNTFYDLCDKYRIWISV